jgi:hypothetical protein
LLIGSVRTEETLYDRPTPEKLALDEAGLRERTAKRLGVDPNPVIEAFRKSFPDASPWDLYILIATDHPRAGYTRELAKRKVAQGGAPAYAYRFDWETPEGGGHMRSPHAVEVRFGWTTASFTNASIRLFPCAMDFVRAVRGRPLFSDEGDVALALTKRSPSPSHPPAAASSASKLRVVVSHAFRFVFTLSPSYRRVRHHSLLEARRRKSPTHSSRFQLPLRNLRKQMGFLLSENKVADPSLRLPPVPVQRFPQLSATEPVAPAVLPPAMSPKFELSHRFVYSSEYTEGSHA